MLNARQKTHVTRNRQNTAMEQPPADTAAEKRPELGQITLVLQGGGALGAYQAGVYQAMHEARIEPDWIIGTSIGAINASLIAGNSPDRRLEALTAFWRKVRRSASGADWTRAFTWFAHPPEWADNLSTFASGIPGFFEPNYANFFGGLQAKVPVRQAGLYSTDPLRQTLLGLVDFSLIEQKLPRLTVGAARVGTATMCYFDSRDMPLSLEHILASGALPPAFPPVLIDGHYYWDGGILSNTPIEAIFDERERKSGVVFVVHVWNTQGAPPVTLWEVLNRQKDIQYSSRAASHIARQQQIHKLRHIIRELATYLPEEKRQEPEVAELISYGCLTYMHVIRLQAQPLPDDNHLKDIDFSERSICKRWALGYEHTKKAIEASPWQTKPAPHEGVIIYNSGPG
jgi:NTE family protein